MHSPAFAGQRFRLTASALASHFKHRCDRLFRWNTVEAALRGKSGIGWGVPSKRKQYSRLGIRLLMQAGDEFEASNVESLAAEVGDAEVWHAGISEEEGKQRKVRVISFESLVERLRGDTLPRFIAQVEILFSPSEEARFLRGLDLDPEQIMLGVARPDLLEVLPPLEPGGNRRLRIWDFKGSQQARHEHFIQVAFYSLLLEHALECAGITGVEVDTAYATIRARTEDVEFELAPYRLAVDDFLRNHATPLLDLSAADAHFHIQERCAMCEYFDTCRREADAGHDLSRIPYISSESKRQLCAEGIRTHRTLAQLDDPETVARLRTLGHDLSVNLPRYIESAEALEDGAARPLGTTTLLMPRYEDVRVTIVAEQDAVTGRCFALGLKTYEGWDADTEAVQGEEHVVIADAPEKEGEILRDFLRVLNGLLQRIDAENRALGSQPIEEEPAVVEAERVCAEAVAALDAFKGRHKQIRKTNPDYATLIAERTGLENAVKETKVAKKQVVKEVSFELWKRQKRLHFYIYDTLDLLVLKGVIERNLFNTACEGIVDEIRHLVRLFPPESILPDAETFRTVPGTIVTQVLRATVALPTPYVYDLRAVSAAYQPISAEGEERGYLFRPRYGFLWEPSNQVAFERIHDVWQGATFAPNSKDPSRDMAPDAILASIEQTVLGKLRAIDSVVRRLKTEIGERLLLRKESFLLHQEFDPINFQTLEALRVFTMLEASLGELAVKTEHTLSVEDRSAKLVCISGLRYIEGMDEEDTSLWFSFDPASRDARFDVGDFNLVVTPESRPGILVGDIDGRLFERAMWRYAPYKVKLLAYDLAATPPRVRLLPDDPTKFRDSLDLNEPCVLDKLFADYTSQRTLDVLRELREKPELAGHVHELLAHGTIADWKPFVEDGAAIERALVERAGREMLNSGQRRAFQGVFNTPMSLVWGPPGTGKTYTIAHILLGYALASQRQKRSLRILVTAFTHHAVNNVLLKVAELAQRYGIDPESLAVGKLQGNDPNAADEMLPDSVARWNDKELQSHVGAEGACVIVGGTVWAVHKGMRETKESIQPWFDVVLVDEASQMRVPDALIVFAAAKPEGSIILAGDDQQLPPIIHGTYPEEHENMLGSIFSFIRHRLTERMNATTDEDARQKIEEEMLFQLDENFRMNEPLTAYPRNILYRGRFTASKPDIRIRSIVSPESGTNDPVEIMLDPERPVVLCWYHAPRSFTARNPVEAELVARLAARLAARLVDENTGAVYTGEEYASSGVALLAPHRAQNSAIRSGLERYGFGTDARPMPLVDTVEKLQGKERDVVLVSYGVADGEYASAEAEFLLSRNRFNVAATRARHKLIVVCSDVVLDVVPDDREILLESMMLKEFRHYCSDGCCRVPWETEEFGEIVLNIQWKGFSP